MNILSVDDVMVVRKIIKRVVEGMGGTLLEASTGIEALSVIESNIDKIDLILLDWNLPNMDGFEILNRLKKDDRCRRIPVIMVTNESEKDKIIMAVQAGASNYLAKPFTEEDLTKKIVDSLGLGYESFLTRCISNAIIKLLGDASGTTVTEIKSAEETNSIVPGSLFGQLIVFGQKKAVVFISVKKEIAAKLFGASGLSWTADGTDQEPYTLIEGICDSIIDKLAVSLSESDTKLDLTAPFFFGGVIDQNSFSVRKAKSFSVIKKYSSGDMEIELKINYFN